MYIYVPRKLILNKKYSHCVKRYSSWMNDILDNYTLIKNATQKWFADCME